MKPKLIYEACRSCSLGHHASTGPCRLYSPNGLQCVCRVCGSGADVNYEPETRSWLAWAGGVGVAVTAAGATIALGILLVLIVAGVGR